MKTKNKVLLIILLVVVLATIGGLTYTIFQPADIKIQHYNINKDTITPGWKIGNMNFKWGAPYYACDTPNKESFEGFIEFTKENENCWKIQLNNELTPRDFGEDIVETFFTLKNKGSSAKMYCKNNICEFQSHKDWKLNYELLLDPYIVEITRMGNFVAELNEPKTLVIQVQSHIPKLKGGISFDIKGRILQTSDTKTIETVFNNGFFEFPIIFDTIGKHTITGQGFIDVYDYSLPLTINKDTSLCSVHSRFSDICVQQKRIPIDEPLSFIVYVHPESCVIDKDCGGYFNCVNGACILDEQKIIDEKKDEEYDSMPVYLIITILAIILIIGLIIYSINKKKKGGKK